MRKGKGERERGCTHGCRSKGYLMLFFRWGGSAKGHSLKKKREGEKDGKSCSGKQGGLPESEYNAKKWGGWWHIPSKKVFWGEKGEKRGGGDRPKGGPPHDGNLTQSRPEKRRSRTSWSGKKKRRRVRGETKTIESSNQRKKLIIHPRGASDSGSI